MTTAGNVETQPVKTYVAFTPYHLILTRAMQISCGGAPAILILTDEAGISDSLPDIEDIPGVTHVIHLSPTEAHSRWRSASLARSNGSLAVNAVRTHTSSRDAVYLFNASRPEAYALLKSMRLERTFHFVEDGLNAYIKESESRFGTLKRMAYYAAYRTPYIRPNDAISLIPYVHYHFLMPEIARSEAPPTLIEPIVQQSFIEAVESLNSVVPRNLDIQRLTHVWFLAHSDGVDDVTSYVDRLKSWAAQLMTEHPNAHIGVKPHPRERHSSLLAALEDSDSGIIVLPPQYPAELLVSRLDRSCTIRSSLSTFVLTSRILLPGRKIQLESDVSEPTFELLSKWDPGITR